MKTLRTLLVGILLAAGTAAVAAANEPSVTTITVTARRPPAGVTTDTRVPPASTVEIVTPMPTDMPEVDIDFHMPTIAVAPATRRVAS